MHLTALDTVGLAFSTLEFATTSRTEWSSEALKEWGDRLARRVTYLMEPLKVLEIDARGARSRSAARARPRAPTSGATTKCGSSAREAADGTVRLRRDDAPAATGPLPAHARGLERLADDIAASVG